MSDAPPRPAPDQPVSANASDASGSASDIPAFVNGQAGTADAASAALEAAGFRATRVSGKEMAAHVRAARDAGARRIVVAGGDGTISAAAGELAGHATELAVLPGGTLNHFARDNGIPTDLAAAAQVAAVGRGRPVDVAAVNGRVFLNTSSVGAYVTFVRDREALERRLGYRVATVLAAVRTSWRIHPFALRLDVDGAARMYRTPIVFIGVGERELQVPTLGGRVRDGKSGLQLFVITGHTRNALLRFALGAALRGKRAVSRTPLLDSFIIERCRIEMPRPLGNVATDGEIEQMQAPLEYEIRRGALQVVVPE